MHYSLPLRRTLARKRRKGFTLVELLVVVLILAILMAVAIPAYLSAVHESQRRTCRANMQTLAHVEQAYLLKNPSGGYTSDLNALVADGNIQSVPKCPDNGSYTIDTGTNNAGPITVHCSVADHDAIPGSTNTGYQPGRDSE
jgi:type IV pilus assembly protein PilA